jgi:hypothetical protein
VAALLVTGWAKTYRTGGPLCHVVGMFLMGLNVLPKFLTDMMMIGNFETGYEVSG